MFPFPVILIGDNSDALAPVRHELLNNQAKIEGEIPKVPEVLNPRENLDHVVALFVVHVRTTDNLRDIKRLTERLIGQPVLALVEEASVASILAAMRAGGEPGRPAARAAGRLPGCSGLHPDSARASAQAVSTDCRFRSGRRLWRDHPGHQSGL